MRETSNETLREDIAFDAENRYLIFSVLESLYAIAISDIIEVVEYHPVRSIAHLTKAVRGVINLRGAIIPVVDLAWRLHARQTVPGKTTRILIIERGDESASTRIGLLVDGVTASCALPAEAHLVPPEFGLAIRRDFVAGVCRHEGAFVTLLSLDSVVSEDELSALEEEAAPETAIFGAELASGIVADAVKDDGSRSLPNESFLVFSMEGECYGINMRAVREIAARESVTPIPNALPFMQGVLDLRGTAVPLVDLRMRCGFSPAPEDAPKPAVIVETRGFQIGLIIDRVTDILELPAGGIQEFPHYAANIRSDFISGVTRAGDRFIVVLDIDRILSEEETLQMREATGGTQ